MRWCIIIDKGREPIPVGAAAGAVVIHPVRLFSDARRAGGLSARFRLTSSAHDGNSGLRLRCGCVADSGSMTTERFAVLLDPMDRYMVYDEFRDEPAALGGHVLIGLSRPWAVTLGRRLNDLAAGGAFSRRR